MHAITEVIDMCMCKCATIPTWHVGVSPASILVGFALVGGLLVILWLKQVDEHLRCSVYTIALQGETKMSTCTLLEV